MVAQWLGRIWSEIEILLEQQSMPYQLIVYKPDRSRFDLHKVFRIIDIRMCSGIHIITIAAEQEPLL